VVAATTDDVLAPPLALAGARPSEPAHRGDDPSPEPEQIHQDPTRMLELQLDTLDHILAAAREERSILARRRRLLEAARQLLLETSAALALDQDAVHLRLRSISRQITSINRTEALEIKADVGLIHQARSAFSRGEREKLFAALQAIDRSALAQGDVEVASLTRSALKQMSHRATASIRAKSASLDRSGAEMLGTQVTEAVSAGYLAARKSLTHPDEGDEPLDEMIFKLFSDFVAPGAERATLAAALSVDGCFDLGGVMTPTRVEEDQIKLTAVPYPTQDLLLMPAECPQDLPDAVVTDPRLTLLDLAAGRLLTRRFVREEIERRSRVVSQGEVRVYVLDGSTSMFGPRARMRDAILVAELATLVKRLTCQRRNMRVVLFYRYFNDQLGPVERVDSPEDAIDAIHHVLSKARRGSTDIEKALIASIDQVRQAREHDPDLARAQIVLITDGESNVSEERIVQARAGIGDLPVGVSVVALGQENKALRQLVARQRALGERTFYHFLPDDYLEELVSGEIDDSSLIHLPSVKAEDGSRHDRLGSLLEELADLERTRETESLRQLYETYREQKSGQREASIDGEGRRACLEALHRDERTLDRRYQRWFPEPRRDDSPALPPAEGTLEQEDLESVIILLCTIAEVIEVVDDAPLARRADAIDLFERLLPNARLSPARYLEILELYPSQAASALEALHAAVRWGIWRRMESPQRRP
jgi:hypothetical protein